MKLIAQWIPKRGLWPFNCNVWPFTRVRPWLRARRAKRDAVRAQAFHERIMDQYVPGWRDKMSDDPQ